MSADVARQKTQTPKLQIWRSIATAVCFLLFTGALAYGKGSETKPPMISKPEVAEKKADLRELRDRIEDLRKSLAANEENKADAASRLRASEREISRLQRELRELSTQRETLEGKLGELTRQSNDLSTRLGQQQTQLEKLLYRQYLRSSPDALQLLLNGSDPSQMARDLHYLSMVGAARADMMSDISAMLEEKKALSATARQHAKELASLELEQQKRHGELQHQQEARKAVFAQISDKVKAQRQQIGNLQNDEERLSKLVDQLTRLLAAQAAEAARAEKAAKAAQLAKAAEAARVAKAGEAARTAEARANRRENASGKSAEKSASVQASSAPSREPSRKPAIEMAENRLEPTASDGSFSNLRGRLRLPAKGTISGRFATPREGGGSWRGLFIRASNGGDVRAIASGHVVFADWMRGFGNLLIIDHGDGYLSIYGNNESLLKEVGQKVRGGEPIASIGNSGGNPDSGLYFELRHQGQPIDPMKWVSLK